MIFLHKNWKILKNFDLKKPNFDIELTFFDKSKRNCPRDD